MEGWASEVPAAAGHPDRRPAEGGPKQRELLNSARGAVPQRPFAGAGLPLLPQMIKATFMACLLVLAGEGLTYRLKVFDIPVRPFVTVKVPSCDAETLIHLPSGESGRLAMNSSGGLSSGAARTDLCN